MYKILLITLSLALLAQSKTIAGGYKPSKVVTDEVRNIAKWTTSQLSEYTNIEGEHTVLTVRNLEIQVVSGINYKFTVDLLIADADNKYEFKSCDVTVFDQPWTKTREIVGEPKCY